MGSNDCKSMIQKVAEEILLAETLPPATLRDISAALRAVAEERPGTRAAEAAALLDDRLYDASGDDPEHIQFVTACVGALACLLEGDTPEGEVRFPPELGLSGAVSEEPTTAPADSEVTASTEGSGTEETAPVETAPAPAVEAPTSGHVSDPELVGDFVNEAREHLEQVDVELLTLEGDSSAKESINAVFRAFHTLKGLAGFLELEEVRCLAHETESLLDLCRQGKREMASDILSVVFDSNDMMKALVEEIAQALEGDGQIPSLPGLPAQLRAIKAVMAGKDPVAEPEAGGEPAHPTEEGDAKKRFKGKSAKETIRIDASRLDGLVNLIGELVIAEAMVTQSEDWDFSNQSRLPSLLGQLDKITRELQETAMSLRLVPVRSTFQRMARVARDVSRKLGKPIEFVTEGEDTELDKTVVDALGDPLVHMVRNAIDHGLEASTELRVAAGKSEAGLIQLKASHRGGNIRIQVIDDGQGLDREKILARAIERGLVKSGDGMSDDAVFQLLFEPGFSTAETVTDVSGRGVGLDVVKKGIEALRGQIEIRSEKGKGAEFTIVLPLTLAIIEGMVVRLGKERFIIPTQSILRMLRQNEVETATFMEKGRMLVLEDGFVPLHTLEDLFAIEVEPGAAKDDRAVIVVESDARRLAVVVDELLGQQQIVIKGLGQTMGTIPGLAGGAIMPDGRVGLILDVPSITKQAEPVGSA